MKNDKLLLVINRRVRNFILLLLAGFLFPVFANSSSKKDLRIYGSESHELVKLLKKQKTLKIYLYTDIDELLNKAHKGESILVLSDKYPDQTVDLPKNFYERLNKKNIRGFIEYPSLLPNHKVNSIEKATYERAVISSDFFGDQADNLTILSVNGLHFSKIEGELPTSHLVAARVGGFDYAIYGLPEQVYPLLYEDNGLLISTTNLSQFITGRYAPKQEWKSIWYQIITYLCPDVEIQELDWNPVVQPTYKKNEKLSKKYSLNAIRRGVDWYINARMLVPESLEDSVQNLLDKGEVRLIWNKEIPVGDGSNGLFECILSEISEKGTQPINIIRRGDCMSEAAMAFAAAGTLMKNKKYKGIAQNLLDYYLFHSPALKGEYGDPTHPAYGLIPWGISNFSWYKASYGDDNARFFLAAWTASSLLQTDRWDEVMMKSLLALLRTTGENGFRGDRIDLPDLEKNGWEHYANQEVVNLAPHFESYLWACYLWAYDKCGDIRFLDKAKNGLKTMMDNYPNGWTWTNGLAQEKARIILPLAWLLRLEDTPTHRALLKKAVDGLLELQDECGAIQEELGQLDKGSYPPPQYNEQYGTTEASLIAKNGDKVSDLLYTTNFAFLGLNEAYHSTKEPYIKESLDKLAEFLCRIQVKSPSHLELDGGWMRAFDFNRFEHWGSNADAGWGAWAIETGWTQGWIIGVLSLMEMDQSIWDLTKTSKIARHYDKLVREMYPKK